MIRRAGPILKARITETLSARFNGRVELDSLNVSVLHGLEVSGDRLRIYPPDDVVAAGASQPLIALEHFSFHAGMIGLLLEPMHVGMVQVNGLQINIPPREMRRQASEKPGKHGGKIKILVDEIVCDNSRLIIGTAKPDKDPKDFELKHIELHDVGPNAPWRYDATLTNAIPRGEIHAAGIFGPWQTDSPGDSSVTGHYTFRPCRPEYDQGHRRHPLLGRRLQRSTRQNCRRRNDRDTGLLPGHRQPPHTSAHPVSRCCGRHQW